jgi:uncharacterized protein YrrD
MEIKNGADVLTHEGDKVGTVNRVVIDPRTKEVTHLVVEKGFLFTTDKVIPVGAVEREMEDQLVLSQGSRDYSEYPDYEETTYVPLYDQTLDADDVALTSPMPVYWYPPVGSVGRFESGGMYFPFKEESETNIPEGTVALQEGAEVLDSGGESIGRVRKIFTYEDTGVMTHFVLERGSMLNKNRVVVPMDWVREIGEDSVRLAVPELVLNELPEYKD